MSDEGEQPGTSVFDNEEVQLDDDDIDACKKINFTHEDALGFKRVYSFYDFNYGKGDGACNTTLVKSMLRALGVQLQKKDEQELAAMLKACDLDGDGNTQFPEFLLLIHMMQKQNFCNINNAAEQKIENDKAEEKRKEERKKRQQAEKMAHRARSGRPITEEAPKAGGGAAAAEGGGEEVDPDVIPLPTYDKAKHGDYPQFYLDNHKEILDEHKNKWKTRPKNYNNA